MKSHSPGPTPAGLGARVPHPRGLVEVFGKGSSVAGWAPQDEGTKGPFSRPQRLHDLGSPWQWEGLSAREWKEGRGGSRTPFPSIHLLSAGTDPPGQTRGSSGPGLGRGGGSMEQPPSPPPLPPGSGHPWKVPSWPWGAASLGIKHLDFMA